MHLVPAPAVKLMKSRVLSRPGLNSVLAFMAHRLVWRTLPSSNSLTLGLLLTVGVETCVYLNYILFSVSTPDWEEASGKRVEEGSNDINTHIRTHSNAYERKCPDVAKTVNPLPGGRAAQRPLTVLASVGEKSEDEMARGCVFSFGSLSFPLAISSTFL
jgi:hypothetical protein